MRTLPFRHWILVVLFISIGQPIVAQPTKSLPYRCGFVLTSRNAIQKAYAPELAVLDLRPRQVIADVGGSNGYRMAMFAVLYDSLTFYIEDIDTLCLNAAELANVLEYYSAIKGRPLTCTFQLIKGNENETKLPANSFDKVLVTASYHHFSDPEAMLADLATKLKEEGRIYLIENVVKKSGQHRRRICDDPLKTVEGLRSEFEAQGFEVESIHSLGRWWTKMFVLRPVKKQG